MTLQPGSAGTGREKIRAGSPGALVAVIPYLLGFIPHSSVVVIGITPSGTVKVTLRYDLPAPEQTAGTAADAMAILVSQALKAAVVAGYGPRPLVTPVVDALRHAAGQAGVDLREALRIEHDRYWCCTCANPACCPPEGTPFDYAAIAARAGISHYGSVVLPSRDALAATVAPLGGRARASMRQATRQAEQRLSRVLAVAGACGRPGAARKAVAGEGLAVVAELIAAYRSSGRRPGNDTFAMATVTLKEIRVRDDAWARMDPEHVQAHLRLWTDVTRRALPGHVAAPASLLAFVAWQTGNGALANVALDQAQADDPRYPMADLLRQVISAGAPPSMAGLPMTPGQVAACYDEQDERHARSS